jgi:hypothetical protein
MEKIEEYWKRVEKLGKDKVEYWKKVFAAARKFYYEEKNADKNT